MFKIGSLIVIIQAGLVIATFSQNTITLDYCLEKTELNHPRAGNSDNISGIASNRIQNARNMNLPQMELNGKASYQSDVISIDIPFPGFIAPVSPRDQYKVSLDITQSIYDGGYSKNRQNAELLTEELDKSQLEMDIRTTKMQVKDLFYSILLLQKNLEITDISISQLNENRAVIETGIKNGTLLKTDLDLLDVEIIKIKQSKSELENARIAGLQILSRRTGEEIGPESVLQPTAYEPVKSDSIQRMEQLFFDLQSRQLEQNKALLKTRTMPKLYAFGQFGYGNPALNMLKDQFETYYIVGAGLKWTIWDWKSNSRDREVLGLQQSIVQSRKDQFESEINTALISQKARIKNHEENLTAFENILERRSRISDNAKTQLGQGVIKTLDYITVLNQETLARIQYESEKILLQQSIAKYLEIKGEL